MQIIIVGCGNVGTTLTEQLSREGHNIIVIDKNAARVSTVANEYDVMGITGNGASLKVQLEAGIEEADLLIAVTTSDELNLLCCLVAKKAGNCQTIARVRNPVYGQEIGFIKEELGLSMVINPEQAAAMDIVRLFRFPSAIEVDTFSKGRVELLKCKVKEDSSLCERRVVEISTVLKCNVLVCIVERGEQVYIPDGSFLLKANDLISIVAAPKQANEFFKKIGMPGNKVRNVMIVGGGETPYYVSRELLAMGMEVTIIEQDRERCEELSELLPRAVVIHGDGTEKSLLYEEGVERANAFISWTGLDEENVMLSLFVKHISKAKTVTKVHKIGYDEILSSLDLGSVLYPKNITAEYIIRYVRAMQNSIGSNVETLYRIIENKAEALEFSVKGSSAVTGIPLKDLKLKPNLLIGCINRKGRIIIPRGQDTIEPGDSVIVVTTNLGFQDLQDIMR